MSTDLVLLKPHLHNCLMTYKESIPKDLLFSIVSFKMQSVEFIFIFLNKLIIWNWAEVQWNT